VNYHLANAMGKLRVDNKLAAIQRACWLGVIREAVRSSLEESMGLAGGRREWASI